MWSEAYRPKRMEEMVGNDEVRAKLVSWLSKWKKGGKAVILLGPPGIGKTTTVQLAARKLGFNLVQLNASDRRTKVMLEAKLGEALLSTNLLGEKTLIFLDEVDGLSGRTDFGAVDFIRESVRRSINPIVMAANNPDSEVVKKLSSVATSYLFVRPTEGQLMEHLGGIARKEKLQISEQELAAVSASANGDMRAAINSLQGGAPGTKDEEMTASQSLNLFFGAAGYRAALKALRGYPGQPGEKVRDLTASVLKSRIHEERKAKALDVLSRVDVLVGRMVRGRDWRLLRYLDPMLASDLREALGDGGVSYSQEGVPWPLQLRIWNDSKKLKDIAGLVGKRTGISRKGALVEDIPYLMLLCRDGGFRDALVKSLNLEENYALFVAKEAGRAPRAQSNDR
ncbi:MAG TPA: AAA family ATPase [Nitrososphaerales archaeon]|nr:AAA family ATPase [Nitrososphaerales archaeon]